MIRLYTPTVQALDAAIDSVAYRKIPAVFATAAAPMRAKDVCLALGVGVAVNKPICPRPIRPIQRSLTGNRQAWSSAERELMPN